ncbi:MAG: hypothetical protein ABI290_09055 [Ginsengibacter sp.]
MKYFKFFSSLLISSILLSACQKEYSNEEVQPTKGNWEFRVLKDTYSGPLDTVYIIGNQMQILGKSDDKTHSFDMTLTSPTGVFLPGTTYSASAQEAVMNYRLNSQGIFVANALNGEFIVSINLINETFVSGTFSGTALDETGKKQQIYQGKFSSIYGKELLVIPTGN